MAQRDSNGRFAKTKPSYEDLTQKIKELESQLDRAVIVNDWLKEHLPIWSRNKFVKFLSSVR